MIIIDSQFTNLTFGIVAKVVATLTQNNLVISNWSFSIIQQEVISDTNNVMIYVDAIDASSAKNFTISDISIYHFSISLLQVKTRVNYENTSQSLVIDNIQYIDSYINYFQNLVVFKNIEMISDFKIMMSGITMNNITFERGGNVMLFQQQTSTPLQIINLHFEHIYGGSIHIQSWNLADTDISTEIILTNVTVNEWNGSTR